MSIFWKIALTLTGYTVAKKVSHNQTIAVSTTAIILMLLLGLDYSEAGGIEGADIYGKDGNIYEKNGKLVVSEEFPKIVDVEDKGLEGLEGREEGITLEGDNIYIEYPGLTIWSPKSIEEGSKLIILDENGQPINIDL